MEGRPVLDHVDTAEAFHLYLQALDAGWSARATEAVLAAKRKRLESLDPADMSADAVMARATDMPHRAWLVMNERRMKLRRLWSAFFREWDVLLSPVISSAALPHMQEGAVWERHVTVNGRQVAYNDMLFRGPDRRLPFARHGGADRVHPGGIAFGRANHGPIYGDRMTLMAGPSPVRAGGLRVQGPGTRLRLGKEASGLRPEPHQGGMVRSSRPDPPWTHQQRHGLCNRSMEWV